MNKLILSTIAILSLVCFTFVSNVSAEEKNSGSLYQAYKKEFAFLEAERANLEKRLKLVNKNGKSSIRKAENEITSLQNKLLGLSAQADDLNEQLIKLERFSEKGMEESETVSNTLLQAITSLGKYHIKIEQPADDDLHETISLLNPTLGKANSLLNDLRKIRSKNGAFFLSNGTQVEGELIHIGNVATYGTSSGGGGALAPAGGGKLKVWEPKSFADAKAIQDGSSPESISIFLYDNIDKPIEKRKSKTAKEVVESGGVIAWVIVFLGLAALLMIILRTWFLSRSSSQSENLVNQVALSLKEGWREEALKLCKNRKGAISRVLAATIRNLHEDREQLEDRISEAILHETPYLERFGAVILVFAAVAPLLGLLGTVTGMISTFDIITEFGTGDPKLLSGGISEALVTTELGLIVAIPTLLFGNLLTGWANRIKTDMEHSALLITNVYVSYGEKKNEFVKGVKENGESQTVTGNNELNPMEA